ncbi:MULTISPECIES: hypothetical protein [Cryobacterium]|uniref:DUF3618 domain-containing protein n=1 Tax=Cryobacterium breve TaxID=1259258 RepID=A0ABY2J806_9MICO|nr:MULTISPECIES: hypothetical protein [Cryobacterium]TFC91226.1 hypothetical protein E3T20_14470 [Cryobacterium sp. TmT3-12]TFD01080.1 hypothetical protein E3O65_01945 [Cryobacterium breve]
MSNADPTFTPATAGYDFNTSAETTGPGRGTMPSTAGQGPSTAGQGPTAGDRAADVKDTSVAAGQHVAGVTKQEIHNVGSEAKKQAKDLYRETQTELADQAATQQKRVATGIRSLADEIGAMATSSDTQGVASDLAQQAATRATGVADWLDQRDPGSLLSEVKDYARRKPGTFIAIAAVAGILAGRLTRGVVEEKKDSAVDAAEETKVTAVSADHRTSAGYGSNPEFHSANPDFGGTPR